LSVGTNVKSIGGIRWCSDGTVHRSGDHHKTEAKEFFFDCYNNNFYSAARLACSLVSRFGVKHILRGNIFVFVKSLKETVTSRIEI